MPLQMDKLPMGAQSCVEDNGLYRFGTHREEWAWNRVQLRQLNDQGGRPSDNVVAKYSGLNAKGAPAAKAGGVAGQTYICKGARCIVTNPVMNDWGLYNGAIGEAVGIVFREGELPPSSPPACVLARFANYRAPVFPGKDPAVVPSAPIERVLDCRCRFVRTMIPLAPDWGITLRKIQGAPCGAGRDAECVVAHPATLSLEKPHPGEL